MNRKFIFVFAPSYEEFRHVCGSILSPLLAVEFKYVEGFESLAGYRDCFFLKYHDWYRKFKTEEINEMDYYLSTHNFIDINEQKG